VKWIKITEQMPDAFKAIMVSNGRSVAIGVYDRLSDEFFTKPEISDVSHWHEIELPEKK